MTLRDDLQTTLGTAYTLETELGGGGMSRVFSATETALGRRVVVKTLSPDFGAAVSAERFRREIRLAASLQQANIVPLLSAGESNGLPYYTMPLVEGESLRAHIARRGILPLREAVSIVRDVARALAFAHERGVVHRDIKPENILLSGNTAVVTDFGIAKAIEASRTDSGMTTLTHAGVALGTPAYIAPEQVTGADGIDQRADIYALGVVAYELLTGAPPFKGRNTQALFVAHLTEKPVDVAERRTDTPANLAVLVMKCLEKDPSRRPASAQDLLHALEAVVITGDAPALAVAPSRQATIAVMPFANMSADPDAEYFSEGMSEEILNALVRIPGLRVIARTSSFALKGKDAREVGERLDAGVVIEGSVRRAGDRIRVTAQLIDTSSGVQLWSERYDREMKDVFAVQDEITAAVRDALSEKLSGIGALPRAKAVIDAETYEMFLRARHLLYKPPEGLLKGSALMQQVVDRVPEYEPALADLAYALMIQSNFGLVEPTNARPRVDVLVRKAIELDPTDPVPYAILGHDATSYHYDWGAAQRFFDRALALGPSTSVVHSWRAFYLASIGRFNDAIASARRSVTLDPISLVTRLVELFVLHFARRYDDVVSLSEQMEDIDPNFSEAYRLRSYALMKLGRLDEAHQAAENAVRLSGGHPYHLFHAALTHLACGRRAEAEKIVAQFEAASEAQSVYHLLVCNLNGPLGNYDKAFSALEKYFAAKGHWMAMLECDPLYDPLRGDPRFAAMVKRVGIPPWEGPRREIASKPVAPTKPGIAVLPFANLSSSADDEYFSDGMTEDIIAQLSQIASLKVISRTSVMQYKKTTKPAKEIASALGASHIVEGSVRRAGNRLRIVAQLIDAANDANLWSQTFDRDMTDVFAIQSEVAERIAYSLKSRLSPEEKVRIGRRPTENLEAYNVFLLGRHHYHQAPNNPAEFDVAIECFRKAIALDPNFARAYAMGAFAHNWHAAGYYGRRPSDMYSEMRALAARALQLDPDSVEAHLAMGLVEAGSRYDHAAASRHYDAALRANPNSADAWLMKAWAELSLSHSDEVCTAARQAIELDPDSLMVRGWAIWDMYWARRFAEAHQEAIAARAQFGDVPFLLSTHAVVLRELGQTAEGANLARDVFSKIPLTVFRCFLAAAEAAAGNTTAAREHLRELHELEKTEYVWPTGIAFAYGRLGDIDLAFDYLERAYEDRASSFFYGIATAPDFDPLREDPRFPAFMRKVGITSL